MRMREINFHYFTSRFIAQTSFRIQKNKRAISITDLEEKNFKVRETADWSYCIMQFEKKGVSEKIQKRYKSREHSRQIFDGNWGERLNVKSSDRPIFKGIRIKYVKVSKIRRLEVQVENTKSHTNGFNLNSNSSAKKKKKRRRITQSPRRIFSESLSFDTGSRY